MKKNKAFTLIELLVVIAIIALLIGILLPAIGKARDTAKNVLSQSRMRQLALGANSYAADNNDRIFTFSWRGGAQPGVTPLTPFSYDISCPNDPPQVELARDTLDGADLQFVEIMRRVTGRCGDDDFAPFGQRLWHRRWSHVALLDYLTSTQPEPIAASPFDKNQLDWAADQTNFDGGSTVPYANGNPTDEIYDQDGNWDNPQVRNKWAFASSYQTVPAAWNTDGIGTITYAPTDTTPHLFGLSNPVGATRPERLVQLGNRRFAQVAFPAGKVLQFEEFDRLSNRQGLPWMYPEAQCNLSFFDGSVRRLPSAEANPGWNPAQPGDDWVQVYRALDTFPTGTNPAGTEFCQRYRWTRYGLRGVDYGGKEIGRPSSLPEEEDVDCVQ
ncbi:MAG: prepilin-type N-terminal cleavage/methylation domain-containing protein [Planctomycetota bacterium]